MIANAQFKVYVKRGRPMNSYDEEILGTKNQLLIKNKTYNYLDRCEAKERFKYFCYYKGLDLYAFTYHSCFALLLWLLASSYSYYRLNPYSFHSYA
jgi:hypothetical protein